jgi:uncharacterized protein (TIGR02270 family)
MVLSGRDSLILTMMNNDSMPKSYESVVLQFADEATALHMIRSALVSAPVRLPHLGRFDDRLAANIDGLSVSSELSIDILNRSLENTTASAVFTFLVLAIDKNYSAILERLLLIVATKNESIPALLSAFGWVTAANLRGITTRLFASSPPLYRLVGLAACGMHYADPGLELAHALMDTDATLRARSFKVVGQLGATAYLAVCTDALQDEDPECAYQAARASALLGDRGASVSALRRIALAPGPRRSQALGLLLKLQPTADAQNTLKTLSQDPACVRLLIQGIGSAGDPHYVPWLIQQMQDLKLSRLAGESFSLITGLDLAYLDLERKPPEGVDFGPNDDPNDDNVAMDEDDGLPWPDVEKISAWWQAHGHRFAPGARYFMGEPPSPAHCLNVLKNGFQRQRMAAAVYLCLMKPGTPLFNCAAPAWRQQRLLAKMGA